VALLVAAVGYGALAPGAAGLRSRLAQGLLGVAEEGERILDAEGQQLRRVVPQEVTATSELLAHPAGAVLDGLVDRFWAVDAPDGGAGEALVLRFPQPFELGYVRVHGAPLRPGVAYDAHPRPQELELSSAGQAVNIVLADHHRSQGFPVSLPVGGELTVTIVSVYPSAGGGHETAIAEIELWEAAGAVRPAG
jgi:hypothetical protein